MGHRDHDALKRRTRLAGWIWGTSLLFSLGGCDPAFGKLRIHNQTDLSLCIAIRNSEGAIIYGRPDIESHGTTMLYVGPMDWERFIERYGEVSVELYAEPDWDPEKRKLRDGAKHL